MKKILFALAVSVLLGVRADAVEVSSYTELQQAIVAGTTPINVVKNITDTGALGTISGNITISGNGVTIDGNGNNGLTISSGSPIIDGTINFINFEREQGGAIFNKGTITSINGNFSGNKATSTSGGGVGGAISNYSTSTITSINGTFTNNNAVASGGAIHNDGSIKSINGTFSDNITNETGGAIGNAYGEINSISGTFTGNKAKESGGAISNTYGGKITSINGSFKSNTAQQGGGAIYNFYNGTINSLQGTFTNNKATNGDGGAIFNSKDAEITSINGTFDSNEATNNGGAIYNYNSATINSLQGNFTNNTANNYGGAIYNDSTLTSISGTFGNNDKNSGNTAKVGGAIYNGGTITSINGNFTNNTANNHGGAIYNSSTIGSITGNFTNNTATNGVGGAIENEKGIIESLQGTFINNKAIKGGAICNFARINIVAQTADTIISGNKAIGGAGAGDGIYNNGTINLNAGGYSIKISDNIDGSGTINVNNTVDSLPTYGVVVLDNSMIANNNINLYNGTLRLVDANLGESNTLTLNGGILDTIDSEIRNTKLGKISGTGTDFAFDVNLEGNTEADKFTLADGSSATINISEMNLLKNVYPQGGPDSIKIFDGATDKLTINDYTVFNDDTKIIFTQSLSDKGKLNFTGTAGTYGLKDAVAYTDGNRQYDIWGTETLSSNLGSMGGTNSKLVIKGSSPGDNIVDGNDFTGITVKSGQTLSIKNVEVNNFKNSSNYGGAIMNKGTLTISNSKFNYNNAQQGGAIENEGTIDSVQGTFIKNTSDSSGGAINNNDNKIINFINGSFIENKANNHGGAISNYGAINSINGSFESNKALTYNGGAIINAGSSTINSINGSFIENEAGDSGGAIENEGTINSINGSYTSNKATYDGGAINNEGTIDSINATFTNNTAIYGGAIQNNSGTITSINGTFTDNKATNYGGAIYNSTDNSIIKSIQGTFIGNKAENSGGAIYNKWTIDSINATFDNNTAKKGGAIYNLNPISSLQGTFTNNTAEDSGGAIYNKGTINIVADTQDTTFTGNTANAISNALYNDNNSTINLNAGTHKIVFNDGISGSDGSIININADNSKTSADLPTYGTVAINNEVTNNTINMYNGTLSLGTNTQNGVLYNGTFADNVEFNYNGGTVSLQNDGINSANLGQLVLNSDMDLKLDANIAGQKMDTITANGFNANSHNINISNLSIINPIEKKSFSLSPIGEMGNTTLKNELAGAIRYTGNSNLVTPIYKYHAEYDPNTALMNFTLTGGGGASDFNPAVLATPVATQIGGYLTQLNVYEQAFANQDMLMSLTNEQRTALKFANKIASTQGIGVGGVVTYSPNQIPEQDRGVWFRPFATFENVGLSGGPNVKNIGYGTLAGGDSDIIELKKGWSAVYSGYVGYNGSNQHYDGVNIYQNGGVLGAGGIWYKGDFFTGLTANVGAGTGVASTMYGNDDFAMLITGAASKTGYNFELANGKFIIQPNYLMSYTFVNTFDYTNSAGVNINSDPLHAIQIAPGLKFIGNLKHGLQPYISLQMVWNIMDDTRFKANNVNLPNISVDPYFQYGIGVQKRVGDRFTGFGQAMLRNGGRNGIALQFGFRWALGK